VNAPAPETAIPTDLLDRLSSLGYDITLIRASGHHAPKRPLRQFLCDGARGPLLIEVARNRLGRRRNLVEAAGRTWARQWGVATPPVLDMHQAGQWMVSRRIAAVSSRDVDYLDHALDTAERIGAATSGPPEMRLGNSWRAPRRSLPLRATRGLLGGLRLRLWRAARAQAYRLPRDRIAHGDYYRRNVLWCGDGVTVIDWEYLSWAPRHTDALRLWSTEREAADRDHVMQRVLSSTPRDKWADIGCLALWLSLRLLGENLSAARKARTRDDLEHARQMIPEASHLAVRLGGWPV